MVPSTGKVVHDKSDNRPGAFGECIGAPHQIVTRRHYNACSDANQCPSLSQGDKCCNTTRTRCEKASLSTTQRLDTFLLYVRTGQWKISLWLSSNKLQMRQKYLAKGLPRDSQSGLMHRSLDGWRALQCMHMTSVTVRHKKELAK